MTTAKDASPIAAPELEPCGPGAWRTPGARIIDHAGRKMLPIGHDGFEPVMESFVFIDKTMFIADALDSGYAATLFCRPRRFGKTLNLTMLKTFFEDAPDGRSRAELFYGTEIWEADGGRYREHQGAYPVIYASFRTAKGNTWEQTYGALRGIIIDAFEQHGYLLRSAAISELQKAQFQRICSNQAPESEFANSLLFLARLLVQHHGKRVIILIDEYDAPVMAGFSAPDGGYYREVVQFIKQWLTGALKDGGEVLQLACLTGVQRISKESIFSDLNNLRVSTALDPRFTERFGFSEFEVAALMSYLGAGDHIQEARAWYDGYRFGDADVYNPWSVLSYLETGCQPDVYWGNTSSNSVVGELIRHADAATLEKIYALLEPGGVITAPLDLTVVFPDIGIRADAVWSMLYLAGYLTTEDTALPNNTRIPRRLRIPNAEVAELYRAEVVERFATEAGGRSRLDDLHTALAAGDAQTVAHELTRIARDSASYYDLTSENGCHMLLLGLCFGMPGYADPVSNRERGRGRPDLQIAPGSAPFGWMKRWLVTIEVKYVKGGRGEALKAAAHTALTQIAERGYDEGELPDGALGRVRWGIVFGDGRVAAASEVLPR